MHTRVHVAIGPILKHRGVEYFKGRLHEWFTKQSSAPLAFLAAIAN